uniref:HTH psq-type domain-containing protein n=1 Tax=Panagrolaimus superbus TaxID=310955 RepID=A0A914YT75_9BILA
MAANVLLTVPLPASPEAGCTPSSGQNSPESAASPASRQNDLTVVMHHHEKRKKKPYKELTLEEKVRLIKMAEENNCMSQASIAERYSIAKSNVCRILQRKHEYLRAYESAGFAGTRKRKLRNDNTITTTMVLTNNMKSKREKGQNDANGESILKPIPRKVVIKNADENKRNTNAAAKEIGNDSCQSFMNPVDPIINQLRNGSNDYKSAFRHLKPLESPNLYDANFITSQLLMSFPSLSYIDDSVMLQAKTLANPALNLFLNHALSKQIEFLNEKLLQNEQKQSKIRNFIQNAENAGLARSSDAQQLVHSLMSLL